MKQKPGILLTYLQLQELIDFAKKSPHKEICAAIMGNIIDSSVGTYKMVKFIPIKNVAKEGIGDYIMDGNELLNKVIINSKLHMNPKAPLSFIGVFHNHPYWRPFPSEMDIDGAGYAGIYIIYSNQYDDVMSWYNQGSDDSDVTTAVYEGNRGFGGAYLYIR